MKVGRKHDKENYERNELITKCVLRGWLCGYTGIFFGMSGSHINYIVKETVRRIAPDFLDKVDSQPLAYCRKHKDYIIGLLGGNESAFGENMMSIDSAIEKGKRMIRD
ncbi:MAG: hypothetical protein KAJ19_14970 [Gammaproteobacteria bacterium]|nr:hypothetical protein [Gammaproteobacteria bacterium]